MLIISIIYSFFARHEIFQIFSKLVQNVQHSTAEDGGGAAKTGGQHQAHLRLSGRGGHQGELIENIRVRVRLPARPGGRWGLITWNEQALFFGPNHF